MPKTRPNHQEPQALNQWQLKKLKMVEKGYALDAAPKQFNKTERAQMDDMVARGLIQKTNGTAWNKHGAYVKIEKAK